MPKFTSHPHGSPNWIDLSAADAAAAGRWYAELFGWSCEAQDTHGGPPYWMFYLDGEIVAGMGQLRDELKAAGVPPTWNTYVAVDDCDAAYAKALELGGTSVVPPMDVFDDGRMAWFTDTEGASVAVWQPNEHIGVTLANEPDTWCWNELGSRDHAAAGAFYGKVFGWTTEPGGPGMTTFRRSDGAEIAHALELSEDMGEMPPMWNIYFSVADCDATVATAKATGGTVIVPGTDISVGRFALLADPQGAMFYVIELSSPS
ncbi:MAG: VOC family protein [Nannocystaceae bacterium]